MSQTHHDHANCNHDHEHSHAAHDAHGDHAHDHDHVTADPGEVIAERSAQDKMLISVCAIAMTLLMICIGTWMQIPTPTGGGHEEHSQHSETGEHASSQAPHTSEEGVHSVPETHETQPH